MNEIKDEIGKINVVTISPVILEEINVNALNNVFENDADINEELATAQENAELEY